MSGRARFIFVGTVIGIVIGYQYQQEEIVKQRKLDAEYIEREVQRRILDRKNKQINSEEQRGTDADPT